MKIKVTKAKLDLRHLRYLLLEPTEKVYRIANVSKTLPKPQPKTFGPGFRWQANNTEATMHMDCLLTHPIYVYYYNRTI